MAAKMITEWYTANPITIDPGDIIPATEDTGGTPATGAFKVAQLMFNRYKIVPVVASNNLTVSLKHEDGTDPSADRPLYFNIDNTLRAVTAATSVTVNAGAAGGSGTFNLGTAELAAKENDLFVYVGWRSSISTVVFSISRIPYATLSSDFSATAANEKYAAWSSTPSGAISVYNIGRFATTNSGTASYNWSVPTYTNENLIQRPIYETRWLTWAPVLTGWSVAPTNTCYRYKIILDMVGIEVTQNTAGTSNAAGTTKILTLPFTAKTITNATWWGPCQVVDNGTTAAGPGIGTIASAANGITFYKDWTGAAAWTNPGNCRVTGYNTRYAI